jgi:hypothetical protein
MVSEEGELVSSALAEEFEDLGLLMGVIGN